MSSSLERKGVRSIHDPEWTAWMRRMTDDRNWFLNQAEHVERYVGLVVLLHNREVYATGRNSIEAMENARKRAAELQQPLPPQSELLIVPMPAYLVDEHGFAILTPEHTTNGEATDPAVS